MQLSENNRPRRDPLTQQVDPDSMYIGDCLLKLRTRWANGDVPVRPLGKARFEVLRQLATFVVPLTGLAIAAAVGGTTAALYAMPVALLVGALLDRNLQQEIATAQRAADAADGGRYELVRGLCTRLNLRPEEITFARVVRLANAFHQHVELSKARWDARRAGAAVAPNYDAIAAATVAAAAGAAYYADDAADDNFSNVPAADYYTPEFDSNVLPAFNVNGMPMIDGAAVDVTGTSYGNFE